MNFLDLGFLILGIGFLLAIVLVICLIVNEVCEVLEDRMARKYVKEVEECLQRSLWAAARERARKRSIPPTSVTLLDDFIKNSEKK